MWIRYGKLVLLGGLLVLTNSCGEDDSEKSASSLDQQIYGKWIGPCLDLQNGVYEQVKLEFNSDKSFSFFESIYGDKDCGNTPNAVLSSAGEFKLESQANADETINLDLTYKTYTITPSTSYSIQINQIKFCNKEDWEGAKPHSIASLTCTYLDGTTDKTFPAENSSLKELVLISGTQLWIGGWFQFASARPTAVNRNRTLRKQ